MSLETLPDILSILSGTLWIKVFLFTFILFYCVFALIALRQTQLMSNILNEMDFTPILRLVAFIHLVAAVGVFVLAILLV
ncbi:MAG: hypothetical protein Q8P89_01920 [bacterium]|nr:hypothetical protein [bacterium]